MKQKPGLLRFPPPENGGRIETKEIEALHHHAAGFPDPLAYLSDLFERWQTCDPQDESTLAAFLSDRWLVSHPEAKLAMREEEAQQKAEGRNAPATPTSAPPSRVPNTKARDLSPHASLSNPRKTQYTTM